MSPGLKHRVRHVIDQLPYIRSLRGTVERIGAFSPGHFYSAIPSPEEVEEVIAGVDATAPRPLPGIDLRKAQQFELLQSFARYYPELPFPEEQTSGCRYYYRGSPYPYPDAVFLYSFLRHTQPRHIIEVGSGFSSAVMLDTIERFFERPPAMTFVEPYPYDLKRLLRPADTPRVTLIEKRVQTVPLSVFATLEPGDLLFIDSSHVVKCGSDLSYLLFEVLPSVPVGAYVHFHDIFQSFEYPKEWLRAGWFWNEAYVLRAFLAHNNAWEICFFNNYVRTAHEDFLAAHMPLCLKDAGGSLYLRRTA